MLMIRRLVNADLPLLVAIEAKIHIAPWTLDMFEQCMRAGCIGWVYELNSQMIGYILVLSQVSENHILNVGVAAEFQHQGYGEQLLTHAMQMAKDWGDSLMYLEVRCSNLRAIALYKKMGFIQIGERKNYYMTPTGREDAWLFAKDLRAQ